MSPLRQNELAGRFLSEAHANSLWAPGDRLLVALSGGADSVALLSLLAQVAARERIELLAAHVNYGLRGAESDGDEAHCLALCGALEIPLEVYRAPAPAAGNVQAWARRVRRTWFARLAETHNCQRIATGHTADDRAETVVLQWLRGASRRGAANMQPHSGPWIRPLLTVTRAEIESYLTSQGLTWRTDSSNDTPRYRRNRVRRELLPLLSDIFRVDAPASLSATAEIYGLEAQFLEREAARHAHLMEAAPGGLKLPAAPLAALHPALALQLFKQALGTLNVAPRRARLLRLLALLSAPAGRRLRFGPGVTAERGRDHVWLYVAQPHDTASPLDAVLIDVPGMTQLPDGSRLLVVPLRQPAKFPRGDFEISAALSDTTDLHVRPARPGDRMRPFGARGTRLVYDLLSEAGVPRYLRTRSWVLEDRSRILWLLGHRPAEETRVKSGSEAAFQLRWEAAAPLHHAS